MLTCIESYSVNDVNVSLSLLGIYKLFKWILCTIHNAQSIWTLEIQIFEQFKLNMNIWSIHNMTSLLNFIFSWKPVIQCLWSLNVPSKVSFEKVHWWKLNRLFNDDEDTSVEWKTQEFTSVRWYKCLMRV